MIGRELAGSDRVRLTDESIVEVEWLAQRDLCRGGAGITGTRDRNVARVRLEWRMHEGGKTHMQDATVTGAAGRSARTRLSPAIWADRRIALAVALGAAALGGWAAAWLTPRGPATTADALLWIVGTLLLGLLVGVILGSRWSIFVGPLSFFIVFELARAGTTGPTVDGIHLDSTYGIIAFVVGRGVTYLLALLPMMVGSAFGVELSARLRRPAARKLGVIGWALQIAASLAIMGLVLLLVRPPSTAPIVGADGEVVPGSIAELTSTNIGGHGQALMIRGRSTENPVLLHLAGGPGGTDLGAMRADSGLEEHFVVVTWEQRGAGKSYDALDPTDTLTLDQVVADTIELSEMLAERFDEERIFLTGNSWGSTLGVLAAQQRPDLYHAFVGTGQMVSQRATDNLFYEDTLAWAEQTGRTDLVATLRANGPPPYAEMLDYEPALSHEHDWNVYPEFDNDRELPATLFVPENDLMDQVNGLRSFLDTFATLYPQLQEIDFRQDVPRLEVPFYMVVGAHEARGRAVLADEWFEMLDAPLKERIVFEHSGHRPSFEEPARFVEVMRRVRDIVDDGGTEVGLLSA
jgi:proline iminopeptidase